MEFDFNSILFALSYALDQVEHDVIGVTTNHGKRVAAVAMRLASQLGVLASVEECQVLSACAVMHDSALSEYVQEEFGGSYTAAVQMALPNFSKHCVLGEEAMQLMPFDKAKMKNAVLYHHENTDGSGPFGKTGAEIPVTASLLQIADAVDALFDLSWVDDEKRARLAAFLQKNSGILFNTAQAEAFLLLVNTDSLAFLRNEKIDVYLHAQLPGGTVACTPQQLENFAAVFARIVDYKSHFTKTHSIGIAQKAKEMAQYYGADDALAARLYFAGALHDIGKLVVDREILEKPAGLDAAEYRHIQTHAYYTYKILSDVPGLEDITAWASHHHEKLDGSGYPFRLTGADLGKWERLMACLDIYQALTEARPYKAGMTHEKSISILREMADGGKLDADIVHDIDVRYGQQAV